MTDVNMRSESTAEGEQRSRRSFVSSVGVLVGLAGQGGAWAGAVDRDWSQGDRADSQPGPDRGEGAGLTPYPKTAWTKDLPGGMYHGEPVVNDGTLYLAVTTDNSPSGGEGFVAAYDGKSGRRTWKQGNVPAPEPPAVGEDLLYFAASVPTLGDSGGLFAVDATSGQPAWRQTAPLQWTDPVVADGTVYAANRNGASAIDATSGETVWSTEDVGGLAKGLGSGSVDRLGSTLVLGDGTALDTADGSVKWSVDARVVGTPTAGTDRVYYTRTDTIAGDDSAVTVESRSPTDGSLVWSYDAGDRTRWDDAVTVADDTVFLVDSNAEGSAVVALDAETGSVAWRTPTRAVLRGTPTATDETVYVGGWYVPEAAAAPGQAVVYAFDAATGERRWTYQLEGNGLETPPANPPAANTPVVADGWLYVATSPARATLDYRYTEYANFFALGPRDTAPDSEAYPPAAGTQADW